MIDNKGSVLVVDDNSANLNVLIDYLEGASFEVFAAEDGEAGLELLEYVNPDIVLLDILMPGMDGFETCRRLKANPETKDIPVIFMTALSETADKVKGFEVGAIDYVTKPLQHREVLARITTHLTIQNLQQNLQDQNTQLQQEIIERKQAEAALNQLNEELEQRVLKRTKALYASEEKYRTLFEDSKDAIFIITPDGQVVNANLAYCNLFGCPKENVAQMNMLDIYVKPQDFLRFQREIEQHGSVKDFAVKFRRKDNAKRNCIVTATLRQAEDGTVLGYQGIIRDITPQKKAEAQIRQANLKLALAYDETLAGWAHALELRNKETEGHSQRVTKLTVRLAQTLGMSEQEIVHVRRGALLHDIGKMGIPDTILLKPGPLTDQERQVMQQHSIYAYQMLSPITYLHPALDIPYCHHEKWNGTGYPRSLKGTQIPLAARIFTIVDVWDALQSDRPYRKAWSEDKARAYISEHAGTHFDPQIVEVFLEMCS